MADTILLFDSMPDIVKALPIGCLHLGLRPRVNFRL